VAVAGRPGPKAPLSYCDRNVAVYRRPGCPGKCSSGGSGAAIGGAAGGGATAVGGWGAYGPPAHAASAGIVAHTGSNGLVGVPCEYGPPWHTATEGICAHLGSSGPVGKSEPGSPGLGSSSGAGVPDVPTKPGIAFAGTVAPVAGIAISATATAIFVIVLRAPEAIAQFIHRSLARTQTGDTAD
jgi:hypothetical protein